MKNLKLVTALVLMLTVIQGLVPSLPIVDVGLKTMLSAIFMFLVQAMTAWRQHVNSLISTTAEKFTLGMFILAALGGLNDFFNVIQISETAGQWIRFSITAATAVINLISPIVWPANQNRRY